MKQGRWISELCCLVSLIAVGCGSDQSRKPAHFPTQESSQRHHNYSSAWIYTIGEVDAVGQPECNKASELIEGEVNCSGQACRYARDLSRDYLAACGKAAPGGHVTRIQELMPVFEAHTSEPAADCTDMAARWVTQGCGTDGACETSVQRWATRCGPLVQSPLVVQILERVIENSLREPRRVKLDVHGCDDFARELREAETCVMLRDCESALPKVDQYMARCAEGKRRVVPLRVAFSMVRIQLGAQQEFKPITLANQKALLETLPGLLVLTDNSGLVYTVCGERVTDLNAYLDKRQNCEKGEVVLLRAVPRTGGPELDIVHVAHESDATYATAFPNLFVSGETAERERRAIARFDKVLTGEPESNLSSWLSRLNQAYASLPNSLRRSDRVHKLFVQHEQELSARLRELTEAKLRLVRRHTSELEFVSFVRRAVKLPFSDVTNEGGIEWGAACDLSELAFGDELKSTHDMLAALQHKASNPRLRGTEAFAELLSAAAKQSKACETAKRQYAEVLTAFDICAGGEKACTEDEQKTLWNQLTGARSQWRSARAREIVLRVSAGSDDRSSSACSNL